MPLATPADACREFAMNCEAPADVAWICTPFDTWERNPRYTGRPQNHPDMLDYDDEGNCTNLFYETPVPRQANYELDEIPF